MKRMRKIVQLVILLLTTLLIGCGNNQASGSTESSVLETAADIENSNEETSLAENLESETTDAETIAEETTLSQPEEITWIEFINEEKNFSLMIPSNWVIVDKDRYGILIRPNRETQTSFYVDTHTTIFSDYSYDDFVSDMIDDVMRIRSKSVFEAQENIEINEYPFVVLPYSETSSSGVAYFYKAFFTAKDLGYEMYYVAPEGEYDLYQSIMEDVAMSFKFIK